MTTRKDAKQLAKNIETLAREVQVKLDGTGDFLTMANELVRNNLTFVFVLGEVTALEQNKPLLSKDNKLKNKLVVKAAYHNKRDGLGRFVKSK